MTNPYKCHRFPTKIITHCVWLYFRFCLSYRDVGLDHGVGHPGSIGLAYGSSLRTEGSWRYLHRGQDGGKHRAGLLHCDESLRVMGMDLSPVHPSRPQGHFLLV